MEMATADDRMKRRKQKRAEAAKQKRAAAAALQTVPLPERPVDSKLVVNSVPRLFVKPKPEIEEKTEDEDEDDGCEGLSDDAYAAALAAYNTTSEKAAEQWDKTILAIATVALGFSIKVFTETKDAEPWIVGTALVVMIAFSASVLISLVSFQATIYSVRRGVDALERLRAGEDANPNERDWLDKSIDWLNWSSFAALLIGVIALVTFGYTQIGKAEVNSNSPNAVQEINVDQMRKKEIFHEGTQRPRVALPKKSAEAIPGPAPPSAETPKLRPASTPTLPAQP